MPVLFDTNILIDYLRGIPQARAEADRHSDRAVSIVTWMEVMAGSTAANEADARSFLLNFYTLPLGPMWPNGHSFCAGQTASSCPTPSFRRRPRNPAAF
jgi:predicted nucleic acid-binding protein